MVIVAMVYDREVSCCHSLLVVLLFNAMIYVQAPLIVRLIRFP